MHTEKNKTRYTNGLKKWNNYEDGRRVNMNK